MAAGWMAFFTPFCKFRAFKRPVNFSDWRPITSSLMAIRKKDYPQVIRQVWLHWNYRRSLTNSVSKIVNTASFEGSHCAIKGDVPYFRNINHLITLCLFQWKYNPTYSLWTKITGQSWKRSFTRYLNVTRVLICCLLPYSQTDEQSPQHGNMESRMFGVFRCHPWLTRMLISIQ